MPNAQLAEPAPKPDPVRQGPDQEGLTIGTARDEGAQATVMTDVIPIKMKMLPILLQAGPPHRIDDRERGELCQW